MSKIVVLCVTRQRVGNSYEMALSFRKTAMLFSTQLVLVIDRDDPCRDEYHNLSTNKTLNQLSPSSLWPPDPVHVMEVEGGNMAKATNEAASLVWGDDCIIGHVGDDHRFETPGWDKAIIEALAAPGIAYGDDGFWGQRLPTAAFLSSVIPRTLGWLALPTSHHYGIDDAWGDLGRGIERLHYLPDVKIIQPGPGETARNGDDIYWRAQEQRKADEIAYYTWRDQGGRLADLEKLKAVLR